MSQAYEQLVALGAEQAVYTPFGKTAKTVLALIDPVRRTDLVGNESFLSKTYYVLIVKSVTEGIVAVKENFDTLSIFLNTGDQDMTTLRITKILPERDEGIPGDGVGMWHLEAVI